MSDEIIIETVSAEVIEVGVPGPQGPAGAAGTGLETLTTQGDTLYRGAATGERLPIGTTGQVLKVSSSGIPEWGAAPSGVSSWNEVTDKPSTFTPSTHTHNASEINHNGLIIFEAGDENADGNYVVGGEYNGKYLYYKTKDAFIYWDVTRWVIANGTEDLYYSAQDTAFPWQVTSWSVENGTSPAPSSWNRISGDALEIVIGQRTNPTLRGTAAEKNVGTGANDVAAGNHTHSAATQSVAGFLSAADKTKLDSVASGAEVNVNADWNASSGDAQILNKPTIPTASTSTPSAPGTAAAGTSSNFARADHVHAMPTAADVGAAASVHAHDHLDITDFSDAVLGLVGSASQLDAPVSGNASSTQVVLGSDTRLSDTRDPNLHAASHAAAGSDPVFDQDLNTGDIVSFSRVEATDGASALGIRFQGDGITFDDETSQTTAWTGKIGSTAGLPLVTTTAGAVSTLALGAAGTVLTVNSGATGVEFAAASGGDSTTVGTTLADILSVSGSDLVADDLGSDKLYGWDDSASKAIGFTVSTGLETDGTNLKAKITSDPTGVSGADAITNIMSLTQAEYAAIGSPNASTLYIITDP